MLSMLLLMATAQLKPGTGTTYRAGNGISIVGRVISSTVGLDGGGNVTGTAPISVSGNNVSCISAGAGTAGCLTAGTQTISGIKTFNEDAGVRAPVFFSYGNSVVTLFGADAGPVGAFNCPAVSNGAPCISNPQGIVEMHGRHDPQDDPSMFVCDVELYAIRNRTAGCVAGIGNGGTSYKGWTVDYLFNVSQAGDLTLAATTSETHLRAPSATLAIQGGTGISGGPDLYFVNGATRSSGHVFEWYNAPSTLLGSLDPAGRLTMNALTLSTTPLAVTSGGTGVASLSTNQTLVGTASNTLSAKTLPSCSDPVASKLLYDNSTQTFSCGNDVGADDGGFVHKTGDFMSGPLLITQVGVDLSFLAQGDGASVAVAKVLVPGTTAKALEVGTYGTCTGCCATHTCGPSGGSSNFFLNGAGDLTTNGAVHSTSTATAGAITLSTGTGTATVTAGSRCVCTDSTANASVQCALSSTTLTATGTGSHVITYLCI